MSPYIRQPPNKRLYLVYMGSLKNSHWQIVEHVENFQKNYKICSQNVLTLAFLGAIIEIAFE